MAQQKPAKFGIDSPVSITTAVGSNNLRVAVDFSRVPPPADYYVADYARIDVVETSVQFTFGKLDGAEGRRLRNKLEVVVPAYAFMGQWIGALPFLEQIKANMESKKFPKYTRPRDISESTDKVQTVHSNSSFISGSENECCIDLYFLAPREIKFFVDKRRVPQLEPLIRIITGANLLVGLGEAFHEIADQIGRFAPVEKPINELEGEGVGI